MQVQQSARLTLVEEQLFLRAQGRVRVHFRDFEELEGFAVLRDNLERLLGKVELELRSVFLHHHDAACKAEQLQAELDAYKQEWQHHQAMCDQVIAAARNLAKSAPATLKKRTKELQSFHAAEVKLKEKQWTVQADKRLQDHVQVLSAQSARQLELIELEHAQRLEVMKENLQAKKQAEIEYIRVRMRLQMTSQLDRETHELLGNGKLRRRTNVTR